MNNNQTGKSSSTSFNVENLFPHLRDDAQNVQPLPAAAPRRSVITQVPHINPIAPNIFVPSPMFLAPNLSIDEQNTRLLERLMIALRELATTVENQEKELLEKKKKYGDDQELRDSKDMVVQTSKNCEEEKKILEQTRQLEKVTMEKRIKELEDKLKERQEERDSKLAAQNSDNTRELNGVLEKAERASLAKKIKNLEDKLKEQKLEKEGKMKEIQDFKTKLENKQIEKVAMEKYMKAKIDVLQSQKLQLEDQESQLRQIEMRIVKRSEQLDRIQVFVTNVKEQKEKKQQKKDI